MESENLFSHGGRRSGAAFSFAIIGYILLSFITQLFAWEAFGNGSVAYVALCSVASTAALFLTVVAFSNKTNRKLLNISGYGKFNPVYTLAAVFISAGMFFGFGFINQAVAEIFVSWGMRAWGAEIPLENVESLILFTFILAVLPAVVEEAFFRGVLVDGLKNIKTVYRIICVSVVFAIYHCSPAQFFYQFIYGAVLTYLTLKSGSVIPAAISHFLNNFTVLLLTYLATPTDFLYNPALIIAGMAATAITVAAIALLNRKRPIASDARSSEDNENCVRGTKNKDTSEFGDRQERGKKISCGFIYGCTTADDGVTTERGTVSRFFIFASPGIVLCLILIVCSLVA